MRQPWWSILIAGGVYLAAMIVIAATETPLGAPTYLICAAVAAAVYLAVLARVWREPNGLQHRPAFFLALAFAVLFRVPLVVEPVRAGNDMFRYVWDGRVQRLGYNPYAVLPADPALAFTHYDDTTRLMPSRTLRTLYPPGAQLFFRLVVSIRDSVLAMKLALIACDLLTIVLIRRWLLAAGRSEWLTLAYAWNPLVVLEVAHSGHIDALCAMWIAACAYLLARRHSAAASAAFALAVASKLLPIVLVPLLWRRVRVRDALLGAAVFAAVCLPFAIGFNPFAPLGSVVEGYYRFNGPLYRAAALVAGPTFAAGVALALGLLAAIACRRYLPVNHPAAWAWPMSAALAWAPIVYPWYLLSLAPFLLVPATLPLIVWTIVMPAVYVVWEIAAAGGRWVVPPAVLLLEYGSVAAAGGILVWLRMRRWSASPPPRIGRFQRK